MIKVIMSVLTQMYFLFYFILLKPQEAFFKAKRFLGSLLSNVLIFSCMIHCHCAFLLKSAVKESLSQEVHLQISSSCWYTLPNI